LADYADKLNTCARNSSPGGSSSADAQNSGEEDWRRGARAGGALPVEAAHISKPNREKSTDAIKQAETSTARPRRTEPKPNFDLRDHTENSEHPRQKTTRGPGNSRNGITEPGRRTETKPAHSPPWQKELKKTIDRRMQLQKNYGGSSCSKHHEQKHEL
jgi:hypothetical protein